MRTRTALLLSLAAMLGVQCMGLLGGLLPAGLRVWVNGLAALLCFGGAAYLGLCVADGDQSAMLPLRRLSSAQALWLCACGALLVCPVTLLSDIVSAQALRFAQAFGMRAKAAAPAGADLSLFAPTLLLSGVLAPVCEEAFFRGYLLSVFARRDREQAAVATALLFALSHGINGDLPLYLLLGLLFAAAALHTGSVLAPLMLHMAYNVTLILLAATPLSALFAGLTPLSGMARLFGCAGLMYVLKRAWLARGVRGGGNIALTRREALCLVGVVLAVVLAQVTAMWAAGGNV